jgi:hypothetical protein
MRRPSASGGRAEMLPNKAVALLAPRRSVRPRLAMLVSVRLHRGRALGQSTSMTALLRRLPQRAAAPGGRTSTPAA